MKDLTKLQILTHLLKLQIHILCNGIAIGGLMMIIIPTQILNLLSVVI